MFCNGSSKLMASNSETSVWFSELTHEFLQILERTPSKLKRIRNWRVSDGAFPAAAAPCGWTRPLRSLCAFALQAIQAAKKPKTEGAAVEPTYQGASLEGLPGSNSFFSSSSDPDAMAGLNSIPAPYSLYQNLSDQFSQPPHSDFTLVKHKPKAAGGGDHQQLAAAAAFSRSQKVLTLERYREKQAAELQNGVKEEPSTDMYIPPTPHHHHKKHDGRRDKPGSKKPRAAASYADGGSSTSEELKMRIKVSSERHGGSEASKDKHKGHRHSKHSYSLTAGGRAALENGSARAVGGHHGDPSGSSRKRPHADGHHHHSSKSSRSSKGGSSHYSSSSEGGQRMMEHHDGTNGMIISNGQHTDYKNTFDMLDSLLSAQGMNL